MIRYLNMNELRELVEASYTSESIYMMDKLKHENIELFKARINQLGNTHKADNK